MRKSELLQKFQAFLKNPNVQEKGELELAHYLNNFFGEIRNEHTNDSIIQALPRYMVAAMKCLREETENPEVIMFRQLYLAARGQQEIPELEIPTHERDREWEDTVNLVSHLMGKVTQNILVEQAISNYLRPSAYNRSGLLQFDGLYRAEKQHSNWYLRFYQDGTVLYIATAKPSTVEQVARWFGKNDIHDLQATYPTHDCQAKYTLRGAQITFSDFTGEVINDHMIYLERHGEPYGVQTFNQFNYQEVETLAL